MAIAHVGERGTASYTAAGTTSIVVTVATLATVVGNHVILIVGAAGGAIVTGVTDSKGNTWQVDNTAVNGTAIGASICSCKVTTQLVVGDTVTATLSAANTAGGAVLNEYSGLAASAWFDQLADGSGATSPMTNAATPATTQADELVFAAFCVGGAAVATITQGTGYTKRGQAGGDAGSTARTIGGEEKIIAATGAQTASATSSVSTTWAGATATYKAATAGATITRNGTVSTSLLLSGSRAGTNIVRRGTAIANMSASGSRAGTTISRAGTVITSTRLQAQRQLTTTRAGTVSTSLLLSGSRVVTNPITLRSGTVSTSLRASGARQLTTFRAGTVSTSLLLAGVRVLTLGRSGTVTTSLLLAGSRTVTQPAGAETILAIGRPAQVLSMTGNLNLMLATFTFSASYVSGGETVDLPGDHPVWTVSAEPRGGYVFSYEAGKLRAYRGAAAGSPLAEAPAGTNLSTVGTIELLVVTR